MLDVDVYGEGGDLVLLHGNPVPAENLDVFRRCFQSSYRVLVPRMDALRVDAVRALSWLQTALDAHGVKRATIIGHSMGAYRAFQLALSGRIEVQRIAALSAFAYLPDDVRAVHRQLAQALEAGSIDLARTLSESWFSPGYLASHPQAENMLRRWFETIGHDGLLASARIETLGPDLREALGSVDIPVYLRTGEHDRVTPLAWTEDLAQRLPNAHVGIAPGAGHFPHLEDAERTLAAIVAFVRG